jgi:hypothetical protein
MVQYTDHAAKYRTYWAPPRDSSPTCVSLYSPCSREGTVVNVMIPRIRESILVVPPNPAQPNGRWLAAWEHRDFLELGPYDTAPRTVRGLIRERLPVWGLADLVEAAELVATELVTNSITATCDFAPGPRLPPVRIWLLASATQVIILVWDDAAKAPVERAVDDYDESGRGLFLVRQFSSEWNYWFPAEPYTGKVTWASIGQP